MPHIYVIYNYIHFQENVALHKPAYQQHPYISSILSINTTHARNAVDGLKTDLRGLQGQCSLSGVNVTTALWWVNLTRIFYIHDIKIYYRTENIAWGKFTFFFPLIM